MTTLNRSVSRTSRMSTWMLTLVFVMLLSSVRLLAEGDATIKLTFNEVDSVKYCKAIVTANDKPVSEAEVHFYVQRMYSLLPIGKPVATDSEGSASVEFLKDLPGDKDGNVIVVAKLEDDDNYGTVESKSSVKWGVTLEGEHSTWGERSLSASRSKAPMVLILVSNAIIFTIWGVIIFVILQIFNIRKSSKILKAKK